MLDTIVTIITLAGILPPKRLFTNSIFPKAFVGDFFKSVSVQFRSLVATKKIKTIF